MSDESQKKVPDNERATTRPAYDPETFARESESRLAMSNPQPSGPRPRTLRRPAVPPLQWGRTSRVPSVAPELEESSWSYSALESVGADAVPVLALAREELGRIEISPEASALLNQVDGIRPLHVVCAMVDMAAEDGATILLELAGQGVVSFL